MPADTARDAKNLARFTEPNTTRKNLSLYMSAAGVVVKNGMKQSGGPEGQEATQRENCPAVNDNATVPVVVVLATSLCTMLHTIGLRVYKNASIGGRTLTYVVHEI